MYLLYQFLDYKTLLKLVHIILRSFMYNFSKTNYFAGIIFFFNYLMIKFSTMLQTFFFTLISNFSFYINFREILEWFKFHLFLYVSYFLVFQTCSRVFCECRECPDCSAHNYYILIENKFYLSMLIVLFRAQPIFVQITGFH